MAAAIKRVETRPEKLKREEPRRLKAMLLGFPGDIPGRALGELLATLDRHTAAGTEWPFVMISPEQNAAVVRWLAKHSERPQVAVQLWALLFQHLRRDTGEVVRTRDELAADLGVTANHVSRVMSELERIGAVTRLRVRVPGLRGP